MTSGYSPDILKSQEQETKLPQRFGRSPLGSAVPAAEAIGSHLDAADRAAITAVAREILDDPLALRLLADRVYDLMRQDLQQQQQRRFGYGGRNP
jgi:hypothetical protein